MQGETENTEKEEGEGKWKKIGKRGKGRRGNMKEDGKGEIVNEGRMEEMGRE